MDSVQLSQPTVEPSTIVQTAPGEPGKSASNTGFSQIFVDQKNGQPPKAKLTAEQGGNITGDASKPFDASEIHEVSELDTSETAEARPVAALVEQGNDVSYSVRDLITSEENAETFVQPPTAEKTAVTAISEKTPVQPKTATAIDKPNAPETTEQEGIATLPINNTVLPIANAAPETLMQAENTPQSSGLHQLSAIAPSQRKAQVEIAALETTPQKKENSQTTAAPATSPVARGIDLLNQQLGKAADKIPPVEVDADQATQQPTAVALNSHNTAQKMAVTPTAEPNAAAVKEALAQEQKKEAADDADQLKGKAETKVEIAAKAAQPKDIASLAINTETKPNTLQIEPLYPRSGSATGGLESLNSFNHVAGSFSANSATAHTGLATAPQTLNIRDKGWETGFSQNIQWMATKDIKSAQIRISPAELGPIQIDLTMDKDQLNLQLNAHHAITRDTIEAAIPRLRAELGNSGFQQVNVDVGGQSGTAEQNARQSGNSDGTGASHNANGASEEVDITDHPDAAAAQQSRSAMRLLDTFA